MNKTKLSTPWGAVAYKSTETTEPESNFQFGNFTGVFEATIDKVYGTEYTNSTTGATTTYVNFRLIKDGDTRITCEEIYTYTAKETDKAKGITKGDTIPSKGYNLVAALVGMTSGKANATATWSKTVVKEYGKDISAREIKTLAGKKINVRTQIERTIYINKDGDSKPSEDTTLDRVFSIDGYSLSEYNEAIEKVEADENILLKDAVEAKAIVIAGKRPDKPRYRECDEDEWLELREMDSDGKEGISTEEEVDLDSDLPTLDDEETVEADAPVTKEKPATKKKEATVEEVPEVDIDDIEL